MLFRSTDGLPRPLWAVHGVSGINRQLRQRRDGRASILEGHATIELELEHQAVAELIELLSRLDNKSTYLDDALLTLRDVYDNAAEQYWLEKWSGE